VSGEANKAVARRYFQAIEAADYAAIEGLLADEVRFRLPPSVPDFAPLANRHDVLGNRGRAKASAADYENHYHFPFVIRARKIAAFHEHLDALYAVRALFEPAGIVAPEDVTWLPEASGSG
jgi:ketosteroid isomerase-like protein